MVQAFAASARVPVRYWREEQPGLSRARNAALTLAQGRVLAFTDDDVRPAPGWVAAVDAVTRETGADVLGGRILPEWEAPPPAWLSRRPRLWSYLTVLDHDAPAVLAGAHGVPTVWGANMAARREVLADLRGFDPRRGVIGTTLHGGEDLDMVTRALAAGYRAVYDPRVVVAHRVGPERMRRRYFSRLCFERAKATRSWTRLRRVGFSSARRFSPIARPWCGSGAGSRPPPAGGPTRSSSGSSAARPPAPCAASGSGAGARRANDSGPVLDPAGGRAVGFLHASCTRPAVAERGGHEAVAPAPTAARGHRDRGPVVRSVVPLAPPQGRDRERT